MKQSAVFLFAALLSALLLLSAAAIEPIDVSGVTEIYRNTFDDGTAIRDFAEYGGKWRVYGGRLYLTNGTNTHSFIIYSGDEALTTLEDYVLDVDMYSTQSQGGVIVRSNLDRLVASDSNGFAGYFDFISFDGKKGAIGYGTKSGGWGGNLEVSGDIVRPLSDLHLQVAVQGNRIQYTVTDLDTGAQVWQHIEEHDLWQKGSFGFRMYTQPHTSGLNNLFLTSFDNLTISTFPAPDETEIKMTIGSATAYVNGKTKTLDAVPIIRASRTMLPIRFVAENLGASVDWDAATATVTVQTGTETIALRVGAETATVNGETIVLDSPAFIENSRTYLPVRFVAESLGAVVGWDGMTSTATILGKKREEAPIEQEETPPAEHSEFYDRNYSVEVILQYFNEICIEDAPGSSHGKVKKWMGPIFYKLYGDYTAEDVEALEAFTEVLNKVEGFPGIYPVANGAPETLSIYYGTQQDLINRMGIAGQENAYNIEGMVKFWHNSTYLHLVKAMICLRTDRSQTERDRTMIEEIINGIGFSNDSLTRSDSTIFEYSQKADTMNEVDELLLRLLYHPRINPGMNAEQCEQVIREIYY